MTLKTSTIHNILGTA